ncbi:hypothetical protein MSMEI_1366 [Mycolicibacterium smegmatis MC2 155]|uniref:Uncharacterized protein n=1 Tax=Mycolicibacterium smegmatis (strain ATCC 700084 / mc(2)155) TaxID=246196 RepID=I7G5F7_MYCS2|nr:hypothetical protein MSMEI_1366 [Mycolicibacterium smegmatis MC2 155]
MTELGSEASGLEQGPGDVVGEVAEAQGGSAQVFEAAVDRFGRPVGGAGAVEVGQDVGGTLLQCPPEGDQLGQRRGDACAQRGDQCSHHGAALGAVWFAVGGHGALIHRPGGLDLGVRVGGEQCGQSGFLAVGEQVGPGVQGASRSVERVGAAAAVPAGGQLHAASALVEGVAGQADHVEGVHHRGRVRQFFGGGGLEPGEPVHGNNVHTITPLLWPLCQPVGERLLGAALHHVEQPCGAGPVTHGREIDDDGDVLVAAASVPPHVLIDADHRDAIEPGRIGDEHPLTFGEHGVVGSVPRHRKRLGDPGHRQVLADKGFQRPPQSTPGQPGPRFGCGAGILAPHMSAAGATVTADRDQQSRGSPPERFMSQRASHAVTYNAFFAAAAAPPILIGDPARQHGPIRVEALAGHLQPELVEAAESRQVSAGEARPTGSVRHVEVFQMDGVGTSIIGRPRPLSRHRRADDLYTLNCEEPDNATGSTSSAPLGLDEIDQPNVGAGSSAG